MIDFEVFMRKNNLRKKDVAQYLGVSASFITQLFSGARSLPVEKLERIKANEDWDSSMFSPAGSIVQRGKNNVNVSGNSNTGVLGIVSGHHHQIGGYNAEDPINENNYLKNEVKRLTELNNKLIDDNMKLMERINYLTDRLIN